MSKRTQCIWNRNGCREETRRRNEHTWQWMVALVSSHTSQRLAFISTTCQRPAREVGRERLRGRICGDLRGDSLVTVGR